jgi:molybdenum cofactor cytidylyltransferase
MGPLTAIVLAAGSSERMGTQKLAMPLGAVTVLDATLRAVSASRVDRIIVVTSPTAPPAVTAEPSADGAPPIVFVENPDPRRGNMSSLRTGTDADADANAFVLVPGDLPTIATETIDAMVDVWETDRPWAAVTDYRDRIAHPFLLSRDAMAEMGSVEGTKVLWRALVESGDPRVVRVAADRPAPIDVNTPADYAAVVASRSEDRAM